MTAGTWILPSVGIILNLPAGIRNVSPLSCNPGVSAIATRLSVILLPTAVKGGYVMFTTFAETKIATPADNVNINR